MKACIITIARQENLYIKEWVDYHLNLGVDTIIICDNNDNEERVSDVINDKNVEILDYFGVEDVQTTAYTDCFLKYKNEYDWLIFIDVDEFIVLGGKYHNDIKSFLNDPIFNKADIIRLCWKIYTNNTDLDVIGGNYNVLNRFKDLYISGEEGVCKSIIRGNIKYVGGKLNGHGYFYNRKLISVDSLGNRCGNTLFIIGESNDVVIYGNAWINHYPTKTIGEYIRQKYFRGGPNANCRRYNKLEHFFKYNYRRPEVEEYAKTLIKELTPTMIKDKYKDLYKKLL